MVRKGSVAALIAEWPPSASQSPIRLVSRVDCIVPSITTHAHTNTPTDGRTDGRTDRQTERDNCINSGTSRPASLHFRRLTPGQLRGTRSDDTSDMFGLLHPRIIIIIIIIMTAGPGCCCRHTHLCSLYIS